jgi:hypothetical protein
VKIVVHDHLGTWVADYNNIVRRAPRDMKAVVREGIKTGNSVARDFARVSAGRHGKRYPNAITAEMKPTFEGFGTAIYSGEYGPDIAKPQGGMSFEFGSRNQKPHLDLARSADLIAPAFAQEVRLLPDRWFAGE